MQRKPQHNTYRRTDFFAGRYVTQLA